MQSARNTMQRGNAKCYQEVSEFDGKYLKHLSPVRKTAFLVINIQMYHDATSTSDNGGSYIIKTYMYVWGSWMAELLQTPKWAGAKNTAACTAIFVVYS